jgi:hypothetical protein
MVWAKELSNGLLFGIMDCIVGFRYRRFHTTYYFHIRESKIQAANTLFDFLINENRIDVLSRNVGKKLLLYYAQYRIITQI